MFTGIVKELGIVLNIVKASGITWTISAHFLKNIEIGDSIAINGVCHTVTTFGSDYFEVYSSPETLAITHLSSLEKGDQVNLEPSLRIGDTLDGHFVYGHVDGLGEISSIVKGNGSHIFSVKVPNDFIKFIIQKGSLAVNGVSLTIYNIESNIVQLMIIPHTFDNTNFSQLSLGSKVHLELDPIGKYVEKQLGNRS